MRHGVRSWRGSVLMKSDITASDSSLAKGFSTSLLVEDHVHLQNIPTSHHREQASQKAAYRPVAWAYLRVQTCCRSTRAAFLATLRSFFVLGSIRI